MNVPVFKLYGEKEQWLSPDLLHCETIASRSSLHNWRIRPHQHHGLFQVLLLCAGSAEVRLDEQEATMQAGQVLLLPQMCVHGFHFTPDAQGYVLTIAYPLLEDLGPALIDGRPGAGVPRVCADAAAPVAGRLQQLMQALHEEYHGNAPHRDSMLESLPGSVVVLLMRADHRTSGAPRPTTRAEKHFIRFCRLIEQQYRHQRSVAWYAGQLGMTAPHLNMLCRQGVGLTALSLIHERVMLESKRSLVYTGDAVARIATNLGYVDPAYFTRFFKRQTGLSPLAFRRHARLSFDSAGH